MGKRKNSTKAERTALLKKLGYTEEDMQRFWDECIPVNHKIRMLSNAGLNWTDLCIWQIEQLPTLKEVTIKQIEEADKAKALEDENKRKEKEQKEYYAEHFDEIMVQKIDNGEALTEDELKALVWEYHNVARIEGENRRWTRTVRSVIKLCGRYFEIEWEQGLTESQEDQFFEQPYEVEQDTYKKVVEVHNWVKKGTPKTVREDVLKPRVSDDDIDNIINTVTEYMYCNFGNCHMQEGMTWEQLAEVRQTIKDNAMNMIKSNLKL